MRTFFIAALALIAGIIIGYAWHLVKTNAWLIRHGHKPSEFFKDCSIS